MDFISGLLLAYDFFPKSGILQIFHLNILAWINKIDTDKPFSLKTILFNILVSIFIFILFLAYVLYKTRENHDSRLWAELCLFLVGCLIAYLIITGVGIVLKKIKHQQFLFFIAMLIDFLCFLLAPSVHNSILFNILVGFICMCLFYPLAIISAKYIQKLLLSEQQKPSDGQKPFYIFAILGLVIFIASNFIQIIV